MPKTLKDRLDDIEQLEKELPVPAQAFLPDRAVSLVDFFILGATQRTLLQSRGFRTLIESRNLPSKTVLLRTQIDTAMRINGLTMLAEPEARMQRLFNGERTFDCLMSAVPAGGGKPERLTDAFLKQKLAKTYPWIAPLTLKSAYVGL
jgi:hypothetical protein